MNTITYKGYTARVEYDVRDNLFVGRILGIRNIISFHGETVGELRAEFELAVRDYLADCSEQGRGWRSRIDSSRGVITHFSTVAAEFFQIKSDWLK